MSDQPTTPGEDKAHFGDEFLEDEGGEQGSSVGEESPEAHEHHDDGPGPGHSESAGAEYRDSGLGADEDAVPAAFKAIGDQPSVDEASGEPADDEVEPSGNAAEDAPDVADTRSGDGEAG